VAHGELSAEAVVAHALSNISRQNGELGAFIHVAADGAREQARAIDAKRRRGEALGPLAGVPVALKDVLCTHDQPTTAASKMLAPGAQAEHGWVAPFDATVVERLRAADAVILGKCNLDELSMGSSTENSAFGPTRNPWAEDRVPGGSSGGSAAAVASGMTPAALGSDTGGSVRQPAAFTGIVGLKPSYGRVSRYGLIAFASSLDQVGVLTADVPSAARLLEVIAGHDPKDATSVLSPLPPLGEACAATTLPGTRIGVPAEYFAAGIDPEVASTVEAAIQALAGLGAIVRPIALPHTRYAVATYYVLATAEASSNLARFDGVRFGWRAAEEHGLEQMVRSTRGQGFGREVKRRIMLGTFVLSAGYADAYYGKAQQLRSAIRRELGQAFAEVDLVATPVTPTVAFALGAKRQSPLAMYLSDVYTVPASLAGLPAISLPCGLATAARLPVGLQLVAPYLQEQRLVRAAAAFEHLGLMGEARPKHCAPTWPQATANEGLAS